MNHISLKPRCYVKSPHTHYIQHTLLAVMALSETVELDLTMISSSECILATRFACKHIHTRVSAHSKVLAILYVPSLIPRLPFNPSGNETSMYVMYACVRICP